MAVRYLTNIDLGTNELQYPVLHPLTSAPTALTPREGQLYYNSTDDKVKVYNGSAWVSVGAVSSIVAGNAITVSSATGDVTINHADTSSVSDLTASARTYVTGLVFDTFGHVTGFSTGTETVTDNDTTYAISVGSGGANTSSIILWGSDSSSDYITISGTANEIDVTESGDTITIGLPNDVTIGGALVVGGNLTVNGTVTTVNTETINLADNIITLNSNASGTPTENAGIEIERGTADNRQLRWNEATDKWELQANDGSFYPISYQTGTSPIDSIASADNSVTVVNTAGAVDLSINNAKFSYATSIGGATSIVVTHNLNSRDVDVQLYDNSTYETVISDVVRTTVNTITVSFNTAPSAGSIRVLVKKIG